MKKQHLHNCRTDVKSERKELDTKDGERTHSTKRGTVVAKELDYNLGDSTKTRFLVATYLGSLYDPRGGYSNREASLNIQLKSTNPEAFQHYTKYLKTSNKSHFIAAERKFLNVN